MNTTSQKRKWSLLVLLLAVLVPAPSFAQEQLVLSSREGTLTNRYAEGLLKKAYGRLGINVIFASFPDARSVLEADQGRADGEVARLESILKHYSNLRKVPVPLFYGELSAFTHKDFNGPINYWDALDGYRVTTILGFKYVQDKLADKPLDVVGTSLEALQRVESKKVDVAVLNNFLGLYAIREMNTPQIKEHKPPLERNPVFHLLHKKHEALIPKLTAVLKDMENKGEIKSMWNEFTKRELKK